MAGMLAGLCVSAQAQLPAGPNTGQQGGYPASAPVEAPAPIPNSVMLDRVVAVINGDVILESDVLEEERFSQLQPYRSPTDGTPPQQALRHLINRTLILQQIKEQQNPVQVSDAELNAQLDDLRKYVPACAKGACDTEAKRAVLLKTYGFTERQFTAKWRQRMLVLKFIEQRFRAGIRISKTEIQTYYTRYFIPQFQQRKLTPPALAGVSARIDEILLQQHVNGLLSDWLNSLKQEGNVAILDPRYGQLGQSAGDADSSGQGDD